MRPPRGLRLLGQFHGAAQAFGEIDRALAVFGAFADAIERLFRLLDLRLGRLVVRRLIGGIDDVLADADQDAAHREVVQDARQVAHIRDRGRGLRQTGEIGMAADLDQAGIGLHRGMQRQRRQHHAAALRRGEHHLKDARVQRIVEFLRLQDRTDALDHMVVDEHRAEQSLLDLDVVGDVTVSFLFHFLFFF